METRVSLSGEDPRAEPLRRTPVGLLRGEFMLRARGEYVTIPAAAAALQAYVRSVCVALDGQPVWYRLADLWSDEVSFLAGGDSTEREQNPLVGLRGSRRALQHPEAFDLEVRAIAEVAQEHSSLHLLTPFVADADELSRLVDELSRRRWPNRIGSMVEIPSAVLDAPRFLAAGATNLLVGLNDLTCLMLGRERGSLDLKLHRAIWWAIEHLRRELPAGTEWGIAGNLAPEILARARATGVPYCSIHYAEFPALTGADARAFPDLDHVQRIKARAREQRKRAMSAAG